MCRRFESAPGHPRSPEPVRPIRGFALERRGRLEPCRLPLRSTSRPISSAREAFRPPAASVMAAPSRLADAGLLALPSSRRSFLGRALVLGAAGLGGPVLLAACGGSNGDSAGGGGEAEVVEASSCEGADALDASSLRMRDALNYVDASPQESRYCSNCRFYTQPQDGSPCGGCQLFQGPVSPGGWCQSWTAQVV